MSYLGNAMVFSTARLTLLQITDGTSNTMIFGEAFSGLIGSCPLNQVIGEGTQTSPVTETDTLDGYLCSYRMGIWNTGIVALNQYTVITGGAGASTQGTPTPNGNGASTQTDTRYDLQYVSGPSYRTGACIDWNAQVNNSGS